MNPSLHKIYDELEQQRKTLLDQVRHLSEEKFHSSPGKGKWSLSQVLTHLLTAEGLSIGYMKKKALGIDQLKNSGMGEAFRFQLLKISQRIPVLKFKAPNVVVQNTPPAYSFPELVERWETQRADLKNFLETLEEKNIKKLIYKHPVAGRLDAGQAIAFFREHIIHHLPQIKRLLH